ncbi:MAG: hypothetical protein WC043_06955 [Pseudobdellovibrionaceae bacterium]
MRSLVTIFLTTTGAGTGYLIGEELGAVIGAAAGITLDIAGQYVFMNMMAPSSYDYTFPSPTPKDPR